MRVCASEHTSVIYWHGSFAYVQVIGRSNWKADLEKVGIKQVDFVFNTADNTDEYFNAIAEIIAPLGRVTAIVPASVRYLRTYTYGMLYVRVLY